MALMFDRVAHNHAKAGFYPTLPDSLKGILNFLTVQSENVRIFDPCCGEGAALAAVAHHLQDLGCQTQTFGIEFDPTRYQVAKTCLSHVIRSDYFDVLHNNRGVGLLWLNPPYGSELLGQANLSSETLSKKRLELSFFEKAITTLQAEGVLVMLIPTTCIDESMVKSLTYYCDNIQLFKAPEEQYKQVIIFANRRKAGNHKVVPKEMVAQLLQAKDYAMAKLPEVYLGEKYCVPASTNVVFAPIAHRVNAGELGHEFQMSHGIWHQFDAHFNCASHPPRRPLAALTDWHLALALASGQLSGVIESDETGRRLLIKGDTYKSKVTSIENIDGAETLIATDRFVPIIRAIDLTVGSGDYGHIFDIC